MKIRMSARGFDLTGELEKYATKKMAALTKRVPHKLRATAMCDMHFSQVHKKGTEINTCSFSITLGDTRLRSEETTQHMYTAIDIAVVHVQHQLLDYLAKQPKHPVAARLRRRLHMD